MAAVQVDSDGGLGFLPLESPGAGPQIRPQGITQTHHPHFTVEEPEAQVTSSVTTEAQVSRHPGE